MKGNLLVLLGACLPYVAVIIGLYILQHAYIALFLYHLFMVIYAYILTHNYQGMGNDSTHTQNPANKKPSNPTNPANPANTTSQKPSSKIWTKFILFTALLASAGPIIYVYVLFIQDYLQQTIGWQPLQLLAYLTSYRLFTLPFIGFMIYFGLIHPVIEQNYWRMLCNQLNHRTDCANKNAMRVIVHMLFSGYHVLVLYTLMPLALLLLTFLLLFFISIIWNYFSQSKIPRRYLVISHGITDTSMIIGVALLILQLR